MIGNLRLLIVDESEDNAVQIIHHLQRCRFGIEARHATTAEELNACLPGEWDVAIASVTVPMLKARDVVEAVHAARPGVPVILLGDSDAAADAIAAGACEVLMKDNLIRLVPAIERALTGTGSPR